MKNMNSNNSGRLDTLDVRLKPTRLRDFGAFRTTGPATQADGSGQKISVMQGARRSMAQPNPITPAPEPEVLARLPVLRTDAALTVTESAKPKGSTVPVVIPPILQYERMHRRHDDWSFERNVQKRAFFLASQMLCTIVLFVLVLKLVSWPVLVQGFFHLSFVYLLPGLGAGVLGLGIGCYQWHDLLHAEQIKSGFGRLLNFLLVGMAFDYVLPFGMSGQRAKAFYLGRAVGNRHGVASSMRAGEIASLLGFVLLALPVLLVWCYFSAGIMWNSVGEVLVVVSFVAGVLGIIAMLPAVRSRLARLRPLMTLRRMLEVLRQARYRWTFTRAILLGMLSWLVVCLNCYFYANALHLAIPFPFYCIALPLVSCVSLLPISINGFGLRELTFISLFMTIHISVSLSLLLVLLLDAQLLLFGGLGCGIYFSQLARRTAK